MGLSMSDRSIVHLLAALAILTVLGVFVDECRQRARADAGPREALARMVEIESSCAVDQAAIPHVLERRWRLTRIARGWTFEEQVIRYSRPLRAWRGDLPWALSPRQRRILARPSRRAYETVDRYLRGDLPDPCAGLPMHWRARRPSEQACGLGACAADTSNLFVR